MIEFTGIEIGLLQDALRYYYREMRDDGYDSVRRRMLARLDKAVSLDEDVHNILIKLGTIPPDPPVEIDD
jgi:hypothetical protein